MTESFLLTASGQEDQYYDHHLLLDKTKQQPSAIDVQQQEQQTYSVLPLGKALHLLLHVKPTVLNSTIDQVWRTSSKTVSSPVANALTSLDHYLTHHESDTFLHHVYDPLKNKVLKPKSSKEPSSSNSLQLLAGLTLWSPHHERYQNCIEQELTLSDKRGALSAALILAFITKQWSEHGKDGKTQVEKLTRFIPCLVVVLEKYGELPTLLACTTYDTLLTITSYALDNIFSPTISMDSKPKISIVEEERVDGDRLARVQVFWPQLHSVLRLAEKWQQSSDLITKGAWMELDTYMSRAHMILMGTSVDGYHQVRKGWNWLCKVLISSQILSKNPTKKLKFVWKLEDDYLDPNMSSYLKILMLALRQNGFWIEQQNRTILSPPRTADEQDYEDQTRTYCRTMMKCYPIVSPWTDLNRIMIPTILGASPYLCLPYDVSLPVFSTLLDFAWPDTTYLTNIAQCFLSQPDSTLPLLVSRIQPDDHPSDGQGLCCGILDKLLDKITATLSLSNASIGETLVHGLLAHVTSNNKSCELLLRCLPLLQKPALLLSLMKMLATADTERANHVTKGLIAKTLLEESWCGDSILVYIDLIRDLLHTRNYRTSFQSMAFSKHATPGDVFHMFDTDNESAAVLDLEYLEKTEMELLWPIQLWSTKVDPTTLERLVPLLIDKYYDAPSEAIFIRVWKMLALSIIHQQSLVLAIIKKCTEIMEKQKRFFDMIRQGLMRKEDINLYTLLLPILILSIFPRQAYEHVGLPSTLIHQWKIRWPPSDHPLKTAGPSIGEQSVFARLADELLIRYEYSGKVIGIPQIQKLALDTLYTIFYHQ